MGKPNGKGIAAYGRAVKYALAGIAAAAGERNFRTELVFALAALVMNVVFRVDVGAWIAVVLCIGFVLACEAMNTAMEAVVDLVSPEQNKLAKIAKDCAAAAVFISTMTALAVACILYIPPFLALFA